MSEAAIEAAVEAWLAGEHTMFDTCTEQPEVAWSATLSLLERDLTGEQLELLAAGPLETLLAYHGAAFIERVEREAQSNPRFNRLLGGVWRHEMPEELWERVQRARKEVW
jgi:hypothetical protein